MPDVKIVALGVAEVEQVVMACAKAGVSGFVAPSGSVKDVVAAVHSAVRGELVCSPRMAAMLLNGVSALVARPLADVDNDTLTQREREIVLLMSEGLSNKQIARSLGIQNATVKNHVHSILSKFRVRRRGEVAAQLRRGQIGGPENLVLPKLPTGRTNGYNGHGRGWTRRARSYGLGETRWSAPFFTARRQRPARRRCLNSRPGCRCAKTRICILSPVRLRPQGSFASAS